MAKRRGRRTERVMVSPTERITLEQWTRVPVQEVVREVVNRACGDG